MFFFRVVGDLARRRVNGFMYTRTRCSKHVFSLYAHTFIYYIFLCIDIFEPYICIFLLHALNLTFSTLQFPFLFIQFESSFCPLSSCLPLLCPLDVASTFSPLSRYRVSALWPVVEYRLQRGAPVILCKELYVLYLRLTFFLPSFSFLFSDLFLCVPLFACIYILKCRILYIYMRECVRL